MARHKRVNICKERFETATEKGFCASQNTWFYGRAPLRYELHVVCTMSGVFHLIDSTKANVHDIFKDVKSQLSDNVLLADKGYISNQQQSDLFHTVNVQLETPMRNNRAATARKVLEASICFQKNKKKIGVPKR